MRRAGHEDGQALIETALSVALFIVLLTGAVEFGRLAYSAIEVADAAQAAAQYATQSSTTAENVSGILQAAQNEYYIPSAVTLTSPTSAGAGYACNCAGSGTSVSCSNNSLSTPACPGSYVEVTITVTAQATYVPSIHLPGLTPSFHLTGTAKRKVLQ